MRRLLLNPYILLPLILLLAELEPHPGRAFERMLQPGAAAYDVDYELARPTPRLIDKVFGDSVRGLSGRPTMILLGNSVAQGRGARDKQTLNAALAERRDVINAALSSQHLITSAALGAYALGELPKDRLPPRVDVVVLYPVTAFYYEKDYGVFFDALAGLCRRSSAMKDLRACSEVRPDPAVDDALRDAKNWALARARCLMTQQEFRESLKYGRFRCQTLFQRENVNAGFLDEYERTLAASPWDRHSDDRRRDAQVPFEQGAAFADPAKAAAAADSVVENLSSLKALLDARAIPSRFTLVVTRESPKFLAVLSPAEKATLDAASAGIAENVRRRAPWIGVKLLGPYGPDDYFDSDHLRESGQLKLAQDLLELTSAPALAHDARGVERQQQELSQARRRARQGVK